MHRVFTITVLGVLVFLIFLVMGGSPAVAGEGEALAAGHLIHRSIPPVGATTHTVVLGERFRAGGFRKWLYGSDYRHLWTMPIEAFF